jgi:hypothetical protein
MTDHELPDPGPTTSYVGRYDPLEMPIILDVLREHDIFATTKIALDENESGQYSFLNQGRSTLLVEQTRVDEAKRLIATEVPQRLKEMSAELNDAWDQSGVTEDMVPLGWFEPAVATVVLEALAGADIKAAPEYALDTPPPPYARADGRVRVHVEEIMLDQADEIVESDVREFLTDRGIAFIEPITGGDEA